MNGRSRREYLQVILRTLSPSGPAGEAGNLERILSQHGLSPKVCHSPAERSSARYPARGPETSSRSPIYNSGVIAVLGAVWEAAGYPCAVRLKALLPLWMPWVRKRFGPSRATESGVLRIRARQMDRRLEARKKRVSHRLYGRTKPGTLLKHSIPLRTDHWRVKVPGFAEVDLVSHSGNSASGEFASSLNLTDVYTGWTETRAILGKSRQVVLDALEEIQAALPFPLLGMNSDNGSEFINGHVGIWCVSHEVQFTHRRPYKKDDNADLEQKNWTPVRKLMGWDRYDNLGAVEAMNDLYQNELRLWLNLFQPSAKLMKKVRVGSKLRRRYDLPPTPLDRLVVESAEEPAACARGTALVKLRQNLDPFELSRQIDRKLHAIYTLAHTRLSPKVHTNVHSTRVTF